MGHVIRAIKKWIDHRSHAHWVAVLLVLVGGLAASTYFWSNARSRLNLTITTKYQTRSNLAKSLIALRLEQYTDLLNGGAGYLKVKPNPTENEWSAFYQAYDLPRNYPGVDAVSFSRYVNSHDVASYLESVRAQGRPEFTIWPAGNRNTYAPITYIAALSPVSYKSFGFDPLSDTIRGAAMTAARDIGAPVITAKISLLAAHKGQPAFIVYKPIYTGHPNTVAERKSTIYGYVFAATNVSKLLNSVLNQIQDKNYTFEIFDGTTQAASNLMYQAPNFDALKRHALKIGTFPLNVDNHVWTVKLVAASSSVPVSELQQPALTLGRGVLATLVFSGFLWYVITWRERKLARVRLQEVQVAKDELLTLASHQLRTPATIVKQNVGILLQNYAGKITAQQKKLLRSAYESNQRQLEIINQFLNVARLDAGRVVLRKERVNLNALLENIIHEQQKIASARKQKISAKLVKRPLYVQADPEYLSVVFENLLGNASQYTLGQGTATISLKKSDNDALVSVSDTGIGMSSNQLAIIFDKFTRVKNGLTAEGSGSGIGLYLAKQIVLLHDGDIEVSSTPNKGSTFTVRLRLAQAEKN